jgi:hypothetical protein
MLRWDLNVFGDGILIQLSFFWILYVVLFLIKARTSFRRLDSVSIFRWNLLSWPRSPELVLISWHSHQHEIGYRRVGDWCEMAASLRGHEAWSRETSAVGRRYPAQQWRPWLRTLSLCDSDLSCVDTSCVKVSLNPISKSYRVNRHSIAWQYDCLCLLHHEKFCQNVQ